MYFSHVSLENGLSQNNVQSILQDSTGYIWFATESGLNRYDGYDIRRYSRERGKPEGLTHDYIWVIDEDSERNLWLATQGGGVVRWNRRTDTFTSFRHDPSDASSLASDDIRTLLIDEDSVVWVGTRDRGLDRLDPRTGKVTHYRHDPDNPATLSNDTVYALHIDTIGRLWVGTDGGLNRLESDTGQFVRFLSAPDSDESLSSDNIRALAEDRSGTLWIGTSTGGLNRWNRDADTFTHFRHDPDSSASLSSDHVRAIFEDEAGRFWVGTVDGLNLLDRKTGLAKRYYHDRTDPRSLSDSYVNSLYQDRGGLLWVGTRSAGVSKWNPRSWSLGPKMYDWLSDLDVTAFAATGDGVLWIGTFGGGLARLDQAAETVTWYRHDPDRPGSIGDDRVMSLLIDANGALWVGTMVAGLDRLDPGREEFRHFRHDPDDPASLAGDGVMALHQTRDGRLWVGTYGGGVSVFDPETNRFDNYLHDPDDASTLSDPRASVIAEAGDGSVWIGTYGGGLNRLDPRSGEFQRFQNDPNDRQSLADNTVFALHPDEDGSMWIGTGGAGMDRAVALSGQSGLRQYRFENFAQSDGLPNNVVYGIQPDSAGRLWLSTNFGLARIDPDSTDIRAFHRVHGLQAEEFNFGAHHRGPDGKLYFGGVNGFNVFHPDLVQIGSRAPEIVLTAYQKLNQPVEVAGGYDLLPRIDLGFDDDLVNFTFAALDFTDPTHNTYAYKLSGFDDEWVELGPKRDITFTNLNAGTYRLNVRATTSDGVTTDGSFGLPLEVAPAPWETIWAFIVYALAGLIVLWRVWEIQQRKLRREAEYSLRLEQDVAERTDELEKRNLELEEANHAKSRFLARMSHEIRTPMNGMLGMTQLLMGTPLDDKQSRFARAIKRSGESLLGIINDILDFSKIEAGKLQLDEVEFCVDDLVCETAELFSGEAARKGLELVVSLPPGKTVTAIGDAQRLRQVLINLVGNAIKFTSDGEIGVCYTIVDESGDGLRLRFDVSDTGVGIQPENVGMIFDAFSQEDGSTSRRFGGTGLGLSICRQLVEVMGGSIGVNSEPGRGSQFHFEIELAKARDDWMSELRPGHLAGQRALVVDANASSSEVLTGYLSALGIQCDVARSGSGVLELLRAHGTTPFDIVILDMVVVAAWKGDLIGEILALAEAATPSLVILGRPDVADGSNRTSSTADYPVVMKPVSQAALLDALAAAAAPVGRAQSTEDQSARVPEPVDGPYAQVLVVEDNAVNQTVAVGMLEQLGYRATVASNGQEAIEVLRQEAFDLVLMDCEMPVMDGYAATAEIRALEVAWSDVPIVALTANAVAGDRERCIAAGMQDYLSKPLMIEDLGAALRRWLPATDQGSNKPATASIDPSSIRSLRNLHSGGSEMVRKVVELYRTSAANLVSELKAALEANDAETVRQRAHALKSSSLTVGACALVTLAQTLEEMGRSGELTGNSDYCRRLDLLLPRTLEDLDAAVQEAG